MCMCVGSFVRDNKFFTGKQAMSGAGSAGVVIRLLGGIERVGASGRRGGGGGGGGFLLLFGAAGISLHACLVIIKKMGVL